MIRPTQKLSLLAALLLSGAVFADAPNPTDAEIKTLLKSRLAHLNNLTIHYTVHTEFVKPESGWPTFPKPDPDAAPPSVLYAIPAFAIPFYQKMNPVDSTLYFFPTGTIDTEKSFSQLDGSLRYDRKLLHFTPEHPLPNTLPVYQSQTHILHNNRIDRLFNGKFTSYPINTGQLIPSLPEPDIEPALLLARFYFPDGRDVGRPSSPHSTAITADALDKSFLATFPDADHILLARQGPVSTRPATTRPRISTSREEWLLDRTQNDAPISYFNSATALHMTMSDFKIVGGIPIPQKIESRFGTRPTETPTSIPLWHIDTITVIDCQLNDPANTDSHYTLDFPTAETDPDIAAGRKPLSLEDIETDFGGIPVNNADLLHLNPALTRPQKSYGNPSTPVSRDSEQFRTAHTNFLNRAKQGNIDTLLIGDDFAQHWSDNPDTWKKFGDPARTANFGLQYDSLENILYRVTHGELDNLSPKNIILLVGNSDAANFGGGGTTNNAPTPKPARANMTFPYAGLESHWLPREDSPNDIAAGIDTLLQAVHQKCPNANILLLTIPPHLGNPPIRAAAGFHPTITRPDGTVIPAPTSPTPNPRIPEINSLLTALDPILNTTLIDLTPLTLDADGELPATTYTPRNIPSPETYEKWTTAILPHLR